MSNSEHPRSTGNLIALDETNNIIYVATFYDGVMKSTNGGATWTYLDPSIKGKYLRSIAMDPANPDVLYVGTYNDGIWKTTNARGQGSFSKLSSAPSIVEEIKIIDSTVYIVAGRAGIFKSTNGGSSWQAINSGVNTTVARWESIDGYANGQNHVLIIGAVFEPEMNGDGINLMKSTNGGSSWQSLTSNRSNIHYEVAGTNSTWLLSEHNRGVMVGGNYFVAAQIAIDPNDSNNIYVAGRSGVWRSTDGGVNWYPTVQGLGVTINRAIATDPNNPGAVFVANTDWVFLYSTDNMQNVDIKNPGVFNTGYDIAVDASTNPSTVYLAGGHRDKNQSGEVLSIQNPTSGGSWVDEGLSLASTNGNRAVGVAVGQEASNNRVILAAVAYDSQDQNGALSGAGIWRKVGNGAWQKASGDAFNTARVAKTGRFSWVPGSQYVYAFDPAKGVYRSNDYGASWVRIWSQSSMNEMTGYVIADPNTVGRLFISSQNGLYKVDNAHTASNLSPTKITGALNPGPITLTNDALYACGLGTSALSARMYKVDLPAATTATDVADDYYRGGDAFPFGLASSSDNYLYTALNGNGVHVGRTDGSAPAPTIYAPSDFSATPGDGQVSLTWNDSRNTLPVEYMVSYRSQTSDSWMWSTPTTNKSLVVDGLTNNQSYDFRVRARYVDQQGVKTASGDAGPIVSMPVVSPPLPDTAKPSVSIVSPSSGETIFGQTDLIAEASDNVGVVLVEFWLGNVKVAEVSRSPYFTTWNSATIENGNYNLTARAYDAAGNMRVSAFIVVTIDNTPASISGDLNSDEKVDIFDLSILLSKWNSSDTTSDINKDGTVNVFDLSIMLSNWNG
ncbi:hypothetical protein DYH10_00650 [Candidatus Saccharibacteria bacterium CPR2]|nr:hypothetical protein [Candidatus Saccharibacteria bacterium CPR2]